jgi:UDP-N-acetyl-2-amino-2-deoxyglucuronate dehydrogenase
MIFARPATEEDGDMAVRFGIVGAGAMARAYAQALTTDVPDGELLAVAGGSRAPEVARDYGVEVDASPSELFARADVDAVIVATPPSSHMPLTIEAAEAGKHVLVEKPMARTVEECDAMIEAAERAGVLLSINKLSRYRDSPRGAKEAIDRGDIGAVRMIQMQLTQAGYEDHMPAKTLGKVAWINDAAEGSTFLDWGCHAADLLRWYAGGDAISAFGRFHDYAANPTPPLLRSGMVQYELEGGVLAQIWCTTEIAPPGLGTDMRCLIMGSAGTLDVDMYGKLRLGRGEAWTVLCEQPPIDYMNNPWDPNRIRGWARQTQEFAAAVLGNGEPGVSPRDGRAAIEMVEAVERSSEMGEAVALPLAAAGAAGANAI